MKELISNMKFVKDYSDMNKLDLIKIILPNIFVIIISVILPICSAKIILGLTTNDLLGLYYAGIAILVIELLRNVNKIILYSAFNKLYKKVLINIQIKLSEETLKLENEELDKNGTGMFSERLISDTNKIASMFRYIIGDIVDVISNIGIFIAVLLINKSVFIYLVIITLIIYLVSKKRSKIFVHYDKKYRKSREKDAGFVGELVRGNRDIKMLSAEKLFIDKLHNNMNVTNGIRYKRQSIIRKYDFILVILKSFKELMLIVLLVYLIMENKLEISTALILHGYTKKISYIDRVITQALEQVKSFNLSTNRILELINNDTFKKEKFGNKKLNQINGNIEFKNVDFSYNDKQILNNLSFKINKNHTVAFVGKTGSGKTTIFNLICKMYDINSGQILLDDNDINELDKDSVRGNITIINQNPYIFNLSIKDNIKLVKENVTDKEIKEACKLAYLEDFISELKDGYDTIIGEGGVNLSGGQRQRLAIARALVQKTEIILFDEATSSLDNIAEREITNAINNLKGTYTVIIIAHRLSTIKNCDNIYYLEDGKILEEGTHNELIKKCLPYKKLYEKDSEVVK